MSQITKNKISAPAGFTLLEVVMTIAIFTMIAYGLISLVSQLIRNSSQQDSLLAGADQARKVAFAMTTELRKATSGADGAYSIGLATAQQLLFYGNIDNTPDVEKIRYYAQNGKLYKGVTKPSGSSYPLSAEKINVVQNDLGNGATPVFYYYDKTYDGTANNYLLEPVNITKVNFIKLDLKVVKKGGVVNTATYTVNTGATIRNLKTNLGE